MTTRILKITTAGLVLGLGIQVGYGMDDVSNMNDTDFTGVKGTPFAEEMIQQHQKNKKIIERYENWRTAEKSDSKLMGTYYSLNDISGHYGTLLGKDVSTYAFMSDTALHVGFLSWSCYLAGKSKMLPAFVALQFLGCYSNLGRTDYIINNIDYHMKYLQKHEKALGEKEITSYDPYEFRTRFNLIGAASYFSLISTVTISLNNLLYNNWKSSSIAYRRCAIGALSVGFLTHLSTFIYSCSLYDTIDWKILNLMDKHADQMDTLVIKKEKTE